MLHPALSAYDAVMPWNSVIKASSNDVEFWDRELKEPALLYTVGHGKQNPAHVHPLLEPEADDERKPKRSRQPKGGRQPHGQGAQRKSAKGKGKGKGKSHPHRGKDGKYFTDRAGKEICFNYNRHPGGCGTSQCAQGRAHICEFCLRPHRGIECTKKGTEVHT